jgi:NAD(P)-dependent dehydrogenase (short-subunit alcohol dehydrogenase family)
MALPLVNKISIVTGAAGGLGKVIAKVFLESGSKVVLVDINQGGLEATKAEFASSGALHIIKANITNEEEVKSIFEETIKVFGSLDILVNNAGIMDRFDAAGTCETELWNKVIAVNLTAPFLMTKYAIQEFQKSAEPAGTILNVCSTGGLFGARAGNDEPHFTFKTVLILNQGVAYTASKHGVVGLTKNTAAMYAKKGIRCNAIAPGGMPTGIMSDMFEKGVVNMENLGITTKTAAVEPGLADLVDVAQAALFLSSDVSKAMTGVILPVDKGWAAY